jgi:hypothetical protein
MPCERLILIPYAGENHMFTVCEQSDAKAVKQALRELCRREGKPQGSIKVSMKDVLIHLK